MSSFLEDLIEIEHRKQLNKAIAFSIAITVALLSLAAIAVWVWVVP